MDSTVLYNELILRWDNWCSSSARRGYTLCSDGGPSLALPLRWRHNGLDGVSNHQPHHCLLRPFIQTQIKDDTKKLRYTSFCARNSPVTGEFPAQMASNAENVSIWWRHHAMTDKSHGGPWEILLETQIVMNGCHKLSLVQYCVT